MPAAKEISQLVTKLETMKPHCCNFLSEKTVNLKEYMAAIGRIRVFKGMDGCNWCGKLINSFERRDHCKCLFQRSTPLIKIRSGLLNN